MMSSEIESIGILKALIDLSERMGKIVEYKEQRLPDKNAFGTYPGSTEWKKEKKTLRCMQESLMLLRDAKEALHRALYESFYMPLGWRRVATPRYKKEYMGKYVTAADFSRARWGNITSPPDGAVCLVERRYSEGAGQEFHLLLEWRCPHCGQRRRFSVAESWITDGRLVFVEPEEESHDDRA